MSFGGLIHPVLWYLLWQSEQTQIIRFQTLSPSLGKKISCYFILNWAAWSLPSLICNIQGSLSVTLSFAGFSRRFSAAVITLNLVFFKPVKQGFLMEFQFLNRYGVGPVFRQQALKDGKLESVLLLYSKFRLHPVSACFLLLFSAFKQFLFLVSPEFMVVIYGRLLSNIKRVMECL